jgi:PKD repeat protein
MTVTIKTNNTGSVSPLFRGSAKDEILMKQKVDDYSMNYTYISYPDPPVNSSIVNSANSYDYVIVTTNSFINSSPNPIDSRDWFTFQNLTDYKNSTGTNTTIATVEEIKNDPHYWNYTNPIFNDTEAQIRNFIIHAYQSWGIEYVLLGGDIDIVPARYLWYKNLEEDGKSDSLPSDLYYSCLDGSYNENNNSYWGEPTDGEFFTKDKYEPCGGGTFYVEAEPLDFPTKSYDVGLFTPSLDFSNVPESQHVWLEFESYFVGGNSGDHIKIKAYSGGTNEENYDYNISENYTGDTEPQHVNVTFYPQYCKYPSDVYIEFYYNSGTNGISFNIDDVKIWYENGSSYVEVFWDSFEEIGWTVKKNSKGWSQKKYNGKTGDWKQAAYEDDLDLIAEVFVGRASVADTREVSNFVKKTISYEKTPNHDPYIKKALMIGLQKSPFKWGSDQKEEIKNGYDYLFLTEGIPQDRYIIDCLYDKDWMNLVNLPDYNPFGWPRDELTMRINNGVSIINLAGHGEWYRFLRMWNPFFTSKIGIPITAYENSDVNKLSNNEFFFIYAHACNVGEFDKEEDDCLAEYFTVKTEHGAFAAVMNSRHGYSFVDTDGPSQRYDRQFFDAIFGENIHELGKANQKSKEDNLYFFRDKNLIENHQLLMRQCYYQLNLFGDPQIAIKIPEENHAPEPLDPEYDIMHKYISGNCITGYLYEFKVRTTDPDSDNIQYRFLRKFLVNNTLKTRWTRCYSSGEWANITLWLPPTTYEVRVMARDEFFELNTSWSDPEDNITATFDSNIQIETSTVVLGEEIQFSGQASGGNEPYISWYYDFGDGNNSQQQNTSHTYDTLGDYTVILYVTDSQNISSNVSKVISVVLLNSGFESSPGIYMVNPQETFYFNDKSKGYYDIINWSWDFGDGNKSYNRNTSHAYSSYGAYNVSLTVTDNESNSDTFYQMIYIDSVPPTIASVSSNFGIVGYGTNVTISVNTSDNSCGIKTVNVNITYPDSSYGNYTMNNTVGSIYEYVFSDCWQLGEYSYTVWVADQAGNQGGSSPEHFSVSRSFGYGGIGGSNQTIWDTITGSVFMVNEKCVADNISVYLDPGNATSDYHYTCVIYPHNDSVLVGVSEEKNISGGKGWHTFNFSVPQPVLLNDTDYVIGCWSDNNSVRMYYDDGDGIEEYYDDGNCTLQGHYFEGVYGYTPDLMNFDHEDRKYSIYCCYSPDNTSPEITNISNIPDTLGFGFNVTITADVTDSQSGVDIVKVNITYPNSSMGSSCSFDMDLVGNGTYKFIFNDTWLKGQYSYLIWAVDYMNNSNSSSVYGFTVSGQATVSVCTLKDEYGNYEMVNLTDPPGDPPGIGYELLDDGSVLHVWNSFNSYYFDTGSGIQLTNHFDEYWSHNVLMLGYYNNDVWNLIYRTDDLSGFHKDIDCDNETFVNATLWKDLSYGGYDFRLAIRYHLGVDDSDLTVIPYIKNLGKAIPYTLGFGWEIKDIQIANVNNDNYLRVFNGTGWEDILLSQTLDRIFTGMDHNTTIRLICTNPPTYHLSRDLYLSWAENLNYKVFCKSRAGQFNAPVTLLIKVGTLGVGQEKYTYLHWLDSDNWLGITGSNRDSECGYDHSSVSFAVALNGTGMWGHGMRETHWGIIDLGQTYIVKKVRGRSNFIDDPVDVNVYVSDNKTSWGTAVATNISTWQDTSSWVEVDSMDKEGRYVKIEIIDTESLGGPQFLTFGDDMSPFKIFDVYVAGVNQTPDVRDEFPVNGSTGVSISPMLGITVSDYEGDIMDITWFSNSSGSWEVFGTNCSVVDGTYYQTMVNASVNGEWWFWNVSVSDGLSTIVSDVFRFYTGYESKIVNTGSTSIQGYLLIQVQYYNISNSAWVVAYVVNETSPRTIPWQDPGGASGQHIFALDAVFNGNVTTGYLVNNFGAGTYRVYACFCDPDGEVLVCNDQSLMEDSYQFTVSAG